MSVENLLADLSVRGIVVAVSGNSIELDAPAGVLTDDDLVALRDHKLAVLESLRSRCRPHNDPKNYIDEAARNRPGWIRTTCHVCGQFIGYRPIRTRDEQTLYTNIRHG